MARRYNVVKIYRLLEEGFTEEELICLCYDRPEFTPVYRRLNSQDNSKAKVIEQLIEYAETNSLIEVLLTLTKEHKPVIYEKYQPYDDPAASPTTSDDAQENRHGTRAPFKSSEDASTLSISKRRIQIYLRGDFSSLSVDRRLAAIDAFATLMGISPQAIEVYRIYEDRIS